MCGRNSLFVPQDDLERRFDASIVAGGGYTPRYNVSPGDGLEVITAEAPEEIDRYRWGVVPPWANEPEEGLVNARAETAPEKQLFRDAWASHPCLVLSSGFYEWRQCDHGPNRPFRIYRNGDPLFAMAGLWDVWEHDGERTRCVTVLTTDATDPVASIHDRMPVVLPADAEREWLHGDPATRAALCRPYPDDDLAVYEVSTRVNDPVNDDPAVVEPLDGDGDVGEFASG
ncbi:MAG: SOS response-associated peptidase [Halolamina sp.]